MLIRRCNSGKPRALRSDAGQSLIMVAASLVVLCGFLGLAIDLGSLFFQKRRMQAATDSGAIAGANELKRGNTSKVTSAANADTASNGFTDSVNGVSVTVNNPPSSGAYSGTAGFVEAIISQPEPTFFMKIFGVNSASVQARAVAGLTSSRNCIYALEPTAGNAFVASGSAIVNATDCGVSVNSSSSSGFVCSGGAQVNAKSIDVSGPGATNCSSPNPKATTGVPRTLDPLATLQAPTVPSGACTGQTVLLTSGTLTINPGVYCSITVNPPCNTCPAALTLNPGLYIIDGGGLTVKKPLGSIQGSGVTIYNAPLGDVAGALFNPVTISGGASADLSAPTTGTYAGILFFGSRNAPTNGNEVVSGGSTTKFDGTLYFPREKLTYSGGSSSSAPFTIIIARTLTFSGSSNLNRDFSSLPNGSPLKDVTLVE